MNVESSGCQPQSNKSNDCIAVNNGWTNIVAIIRRDKLRFNDLIVNEEFRVRIMYLCVFCIFFVVSSVMTVVNFITGWNILKNVTFVFAGMNLVNLILSLVSKQTEMLSRVLSAIELIIMFTAFLVIGEPEGFSAIWIALLPACGMILYRFKFGTIVASVQLIIMLFLLWTQTGNSFLLYEYTDSFKLRFPLLYIASFMLGLAFEYIRFQIQKALMDSRAEFERLSKHDPLTGLFNRLGFYAEIDRAMAGEGIGAAAANGSYAFALIDYDGFKQINDGYGHNVGDIVLRDSAATIRNIVGDHGCVCRWGGDEVSIFFYSAEHAEELGNQILEGIRNLRFPDEASHVHATVSVGLAKAKPGSGKFIVEDVINAADNILYRAKDAGRNRMLVTEYEKNLEKD